MDYSAHRISVGFPAIEAIYLKIKVSVAVNI
jgi:hypothetical protein